MKTNTTSKVVAAVIGFTMALTAFAAVGASTAAADSSMTLTQLVNLFIQLGIIAPDKAAAALAAVNSSATTATTFTRDLTVGSQGADVTALQNAIGVTPATGYFGSITKAAVQKYQAANGIPATGYVGPLTRAALNKASSASTVATTGTTTTTTTTTGTTATTPVVNSGVEGILSADQGPVSNSNVYAGQTNVPVIAIKLTAKLSDINVQRVQVQLGTDTTIYTKLFKTMYLLDDSGKVIAQADLNSNTVVKSGSDYYLTFSGFSYTIPKDATKTLTVTGDLYSTIESSQTGARTITIEQNGVRGVDGAGIDEYAPSGSAGISQTITVGQSLADSAQLLVSTDAANFLSSDVVAASGSNNNQYDKLPLLAFDVRAQKDTVEITDLTATVNGTGVATATAAYLYDGSTLLGSASVNAVSGKAEFTNINYWVPQDTTKVLTLKADISSAASSVSTEQAVVNPSDVSAQNSQGSTVTPTGTATGNTFNIRNVGPVFTLNSATIAKGATASQNNYSTSTADATFNLTVQAVGGDIYFGTQTAHNTFGFGIYQNGALAALPVASSTSWSVPSQGVVTSSTFNPDISFEISQNNSATIPVDFYLEGRNADGSLLSGGSYAVGLEKVNWSTSSTFSTTTSTFMAGQTAWRTPAVQLP